MKKAVGHVLYNPLSYVFEMVELGGSHSQVYDSLTQEFEPDRMITPYVLQPRLIVQDPDGVIHSGDVTSFMVNVKWSMHFSTEGVETDVDLDVDGSMASVDEKNGYKLTFYMNSHPSVALKLKFYGEYLDTKRNEVQVFKWEKDIISETQLQYDFKLFLDTPNKTLLSPFRMREKISVTARLMNGDQDVTTLSRFRWYWWTNGKFVNLDGIENSEDADYYPLWLNFVSFSTLHVLQSRIQDVIIKCEATLNGQSVSKVFRMRRWYGQWEEHLDMLTGQFVLPGQTRAVALVSVSNRKEELEDPTHLFDIEIFHSEDGKDWTSITNNNYYILDSPNLPNEPHQFGCVVREKTADIALVLPDGRPLVCPDGSYLVVNVPEEK